MLLSVTVHFEAAHRLVGLPEGHKCARLHGHNYRAIVTVAGPLQPNGFVIDAGELLDIIGAHPESRAFLPLDHQCLNEMAGWSEWMAAQPTAERIARAMFEHVWSTICHHGLSVDSVQVFETEWLSVTYRGVGR